MSYVWDFHAQVILLLGIVLPYSIYILFDAPGSGFGIVQAFSKGVFPDRQQRCGQDLALLFSGQLYNSHDSFPFSFANTAVCIGLISDYDHINKRSLMLANEWVATEAYHLVLGDMLLVASNRIPMLCAKNSRIVRGQTLRLARRKCIAKLFRRSTKTIFGRDQRFFAVVLSHMNLGNGIRLMAIHSLLKPVGRAKIEAIAN